MIANLTITIFADGCLMDDCQNINTIFDNDDWLLSCLPQAGINDFRMTLGMTTMTPKGPVRMSICAEPTTVIVVDVNRSR